MFAHNIIAPFICRLEDESQAKIRKKLDTIMMASNVTILLCVPAIVVMLMKM
jgi:hypothetical protein